MSKKDNSRSRSSELTGGEGYTYEDTVVAYYLTGLLHAGVVPGIEGRATKVAVQQAAQGEPLDDLIVDTEISGEARRLSLQVKRSLTISNAKTNTDFREIIAGARATRAKDDFRVGKDKYGFIARSVANQRFQGLKRIIDWAKSSGTGAEFEARFAIGAEASKNDRELRTALRTFIEPANADVEADFYRHFVALRMDGLEPDEPSYMEMVNRLGQIAVGADGGRTLFELLCRQVRVGQGDAKHWRRPSLLSDLRTLVPLRVAPAFADDLNVLSLLGKAYCQDILSDIDGVCLPRKDITDFVMDASEKHRFTNIRGLPGVGKSVVLKQIIEGASAEGPVLFLKSDRLEGASWASHAQAIGITTRNPIELMAQIGTAGTPILFIDGIDRIAPQHRGVVKDLLSAIESEPGLSHWRVVATSRDQGLEAYRQWVPVSFYRSTGIGDVQVTGLSDVEAEELADQKPTLRGLLFGPVAIREIARRPFFASVLAKQFQDDVDDQPPPTTEIELIEAWWRAGGYNSAPEDVLLRQRAMIDCAETGAQSLGKLIQVRNLKSETMTALSGLSQDDIIRPVEEGTICSFGHDIYFEWSFYKLFIDAGDQWVEALKATGEPPFLARIVGLFSQHVFEQRDDWVSGFRHLNESQVRPQWRRAWLLGPTDSAKFSNRSGTFEALLFAENFELLEKFLTWFQAERTIPNPIILNRPPSTLDSAKLIRVADYLGWPSDLDSWRRVLTWTLDRADNLPVSVFPSVVELFAVWQNMLADINNPLSQRIIDCAEKWLDELTAERPPASSTASRWEGLGRDGYGSFKSALRQLILRSARTFPETARRQVEKAQKVGRKSEDLFREITGFSPILAEVCPDALAELTRQEILEELPKDEIDRKSKEREERYKRLKAMRAKPEAERTDDERRILSAPTFIPSAKSYNFDDIGINRHHRAFYPATPLNQPFSALFETAPEQARALVRSLGNHAVTGWRQIHDINAPRCGTPLPVEANFPWGRQTFWGDNQTYGWFLGATGPQPLQSAFLALTYWAHKSIDAGRSVDEIIKDAIEGHESWSVLGLGVSLALETFHISETVLALLSLQRLWHVDSARQVHDSLKHLVLPGLDPRDRMTQAEQEAFSYLQTRKFRRRSIQDLAPIFALSANKSLRDGAREALAGFPDALPFAYLEEQTDRQREQELQEQAKIWASWGDRANYKTEPVPDVENAIQVTYIAPEQPSAKAQATLRESHLTLADFQVLAWAMKSLEANTLDPGLDLDAAISHVKDRYKDDLFATVAELGEGTKQSCISAVAAVATCFSKRNQEWGWEILLRVEQLEERSIGFRDLHDPYHPKLFLIEALWHDLKSKKPRTDSETRLLSLCSNNNSEISKAALVAGVQLHAHQPNLAWIFAAIATELFCWPVPDSSDDGSHHNEAQLAHQTSALRRALDALDTTNQPELTPPPPAWVNEPIKNPREWDNDPNTPVWRRPDIDFNHMFARDVLSVFPIEDWMQSEKYREPCLEYFRQLFEWTKNRTFPPWQEKGRDHSATELYEWSSAFSHLCVRASVHMPANEAIQQFIEPITKLPNEDALHFAADIVTATACRRVMDAQVVSDDAIAILSVCLERLLKERCFDPNSYRAGEPYGFAMPQMIRDLMFVSVKNASGAARFANGDWSQLDQVMPLIDRLMEGAGWSEFVMETYLTLCERAGAALSIDAFTRHVSPHLESGTTHLPAWRGTTIAARIAGVIQSLADTNHPLNHQEAQSLLIILDHLVDLGDRRAAALQQSPHFREIQV